MRNILELMVIYQINSTAEMWAMKLSQRIYVNEIKAITQKVHGLHFNAHKATADDVTGFNIKTLIDKF